MKIGRFTLTILATAATMLFAASFTQAQNNRSWVASTGNDANVCDRANPCRTFQRAVNQTNNQGEVDVIDAGDYSNIPAGSLVITKSVTIDGGGLGFITGGNATAADAVQVNTPAITDVVTLRRLSINGTHPGGAPSAPFEGVHFLTTSRGALVLEHCQVSNFSNSAVNFEPAALSNTLFVRDCEFTNNEFFGIKGNGGGGSAFGSIDNVRVSNNGIFGTGSGIVLSGAGGGNVRFNVSDSVSAYNGLVGIQATGGASPTAVSVNVESTQVVGNNINLQSGFGGVATIRISNVDIFDATANGLAFTGGSNIISFGNNRIANNIGSNGPPSGTLAQQ